MHTFFLILASMFYLIGFGCWIVIVIDAFKDEVWKGLLCLVTCWLFSLYFALVEFDHERKWPIVIGWIAGWLIGGALTPLAY